MTIAIEKEVASKTCATPQLPRKQPMRSYCVRKIGKHRGSPRLWLQGRVPASAGFLPATPFKVLVDIEQGRVTLRSSAEGDRMVSHKHRHGKTIPVVDINSAEILGIFAGFERIRVIAMDGVIHILPLATDKRVKDRLDRLREELANDKPLSTGDVSHGGGILAHALHEGLAEAGISSEMLFANDIREDLLEHASEHNPAWTEKTTMLAAPMQELAFDEWAISRLPSCSFFHGGIPCQGASLSGRSKNAIPCPEAHEDVGHLVAAFLTLVGRINPAIVLVENVPLWQSSASMWILRHQMRDLDYQVHEMQLNGQEWNSLEDRRRLCIVAVSKGLEFRPEDVERPEPQVRTLESILENIPSEGKRWSEMKYLKDKAVRDKEAGKGFKMQVVTADSTKVGTIGKSYWKNRSTEAKVQSSENPEMLRLLTPKEHAAIKGINFSLIENLCSTTSHELMGQSVLPPPFRSVGKAIGLMLKRFISAKESIQPPQGQLLLT